MRRSTPLLLAVFALGPLGCDTPRPHPEAEAEPLPIQEIVIPMRGQSKTVLYAVPELVEEDDGPRIDFDSSLTLALGDGYPLRVTASLPDEWWGVCGLANAPFELEEVTGGDEVVAATLVDGALFVVPQRTGRTTLLGTGVVTFVEAGCDQPAGTVLAFDLRVSIDVRRPTGATIVAPCSSEGVFVATSATPSSAWGTTGLHVRLVDDEGEFIADNADPDAQVEVRVIGAFDRYRAAITRLSEWRASSQPGPVEIIPAMGDPLTVRVVGPDAVGEVDLDVQIAGAAAGPTTLENGGSYGPGWGRTANRVAPMVQELRIGRTPLCSAPDPDWFELISHTPQVCEVVELSPNGDEGYLLDGSRTGQAARLLQDGTCSFELRGPGDPLPLAFTATFEGTDALHDW